MNNAWKIGIGTAIALSVYLWSVSRKPSKAVKVLAIGDSLTASVAYCASLKDQLPAGSTLSCRGLKGQGTAPILRELKESMEPTYDYVVVLAGVNDLASGRSMDSIQRNLEQMYLEIRANGAKTIAVTLTPWAGNSMGKTLIAETDELNNWIRRHKVPDRVVDTSSLGDFSGRLHSRYGAADGLHLNPEGSTKLAELVWKKGF